MDPIVARKMHRTLEPYYGMIYFAPAAARAYADVGVEDRQSGYFASRAAPMGAVAADVVTATFFNFHPDLVRRSLDGVWERTTPADLVDARLRAADEALREYLGPATDGPEVREAADLARRAVAACEPAGRPLGAANAALAWPDEPHLGLWHGIGVLREFRGDGHVATLVERGVAPCEALVLHAGSGEVPESTLRATRAWPDAAWDAAATALVDRGLIDGDRRLTDAGAAFREDLERRTDELAIGVWAPLGDESCRRLRALVRPLSRAVLDHGAFGTNSPARARFQGAKRPDERS